VSRRVSLRRGGEGELEPSPRGFTAESEDLHVPIKNHRRHHPRQPTRQDPAQDEIIDSLPSEHQVVRSDLDLSSPSHRLLHRSYHPPHLLDDPQPPWSKSGLLLVSVSSFLDDSKEPDDVPSDKRLEEESARENKVGGVVEEWDVESEEAEESGDEEPVGEGEEEEGPEGVRGGEEAHQREEGRKEGKGGR